MTKSTPRESMPSDQVHAMRVQASQSSPHHKSQGLATNPMPGPCNQTHKRASRPKPRPGPCLQPLPRDPKRDLDPIGALCYGPLEGLPKELRSRCAESTNEIAEDKPVVSPPKLGARLPSSETLKTSSSLLHHLNPCQQSDVIAFIDHFSYFFSDIPIQTTMLKHDIIVEAKPTKQHAYRVNPVKHAVRR